MTIQEFLQQEGYLLSFSEIERYLNIPQGTLHLIQKGKINLQPQDQTKFIEFVKTLGFGLRSIFFIK